jgi:hypothetical protein
MTDRRFGLAISSAWIIAAQPIFKMFQLFMFTCIKVKPPYLDVGSGVTQPGSIFGWTRGSTLLGSSYLPSLPVTTVTAINGEVLGPSVYGQGWYPASNTLTVRVTTPTALSAWPVLNNAATGIYHFTIWDLTCEGCGSQVDATVHVVVTR